MSDDKKPLFRLGEDLVDAWGNTHDESEPEDGVDYTKWPAKELKAEIDRRNETREEEDQIVLEDNKKSTAAAALAADDEADDEAHAEDNEEE